MTYRIVRTLLTAGLLMVVAPTAAGAEPDPQADDPDVVQAPETEAGESSTTFDLEHRRQLYENRRLNPWRAVGYTAIFPGLGNFYVEQYAVGTVALTAMVFTGMFVGFGLMYGHTDLLWIGGTTAATAYLGGAVTSYMGARQYNRQLEQSLHLPDDAEQASGRPSPGWGLGLQWRF